MINWIPEINKFYNFKIVNDGNIHRCVVLKELDDALKIVEEDYNFVVDSKQQEKEEYDGLSKVPVIKIIPKSIITEIIEASDETFNFKYFKDNNERIRKVLVNPKMEKFFNEKLYSTKEEVQ